MRTAVLCTILGSIAGCGRPGSDAPVVTSSTSHSNVSEDLAEEYDLGEYAIRPPKNFELKSDDQLPKKLGRSVVWRSADDRRGFSVALIAVPADDGPGTPELVRELVRSKGMTNHMETPPQRVKLAGLDFEICFAEYTLRNDEKKHSSVVYSHANGQKGIVITYTGPAGADETQSRIAASAARSLRKP